MPAWRRMLAIGTLAVLTACGGGVSDGGTGGTGDTSATGAATNSEEQTTEPSLEPTGPESTGSVEKKPSIEIANAPIGGQTGFGPEDCVAVNWLGTEPIPDGITIKLGSIALDPEGIFELDQGSCDDDDEAPPCAGHEWQGDDPPDCYVGAKQVALAGEVDRVFVILAVTVTCESQANCDSLAADPENGVGSSVVFEPDDAEFGTPTESPSESSSESPTNG